MKTTMLAVVALSLATGVAVAGEAPKPADPVQAAIVATALDYADGFYSGAPERMERALHPDLSKAVVVPTPKTGAPFLSYSSWSGLIEYTRTGAGVLEAGKRKLTADTLTVDGNVACARVRSAQFNDYLTLVETDAGWKIVNVLWAPGPDTSYPRLNTEFEPEAEKPRAEEAVRRFYVGLMAGDADPVAAILHPESRPGSVETFADTGRVAIRRRGYSQVVEVTRAKLRVAPEDQRGLEVHALDLMDGMAMVEVSSPGFASWVQLNRIGGEWRIINILTRRNPKPPAPKG